MADLPTPRSVGDIYLAAVVDRLDRVARLLEDLLARLSQPVGDNLPDGPAASGHPTSEEAAVSNVDEVQEPAPTAATAVTEPAPVKPKAKKTAAKAAPPTQVKES